MMVQNVSGRRIPLTAKPEPSFPSTGSPLYDRENRSIRNHIDPNLPKRVENFRNQLEWGIRPASINQNLDIRVDNLREESDLGGRHDIPFFPRIRTMSPRTHQRLIAQNERREKILLCKGLIIISTLSSGFLYLFFKKL